MCSTPRPCLTTLVARRRVMSPRRSAGAPRRAHLRTTAGTCRRQSRGMGGMESGRESAALTVVADAEPFEIARAAYRRHAFAPHAHETWAVGALESGACRT